MYTSVHLLNVFTLPRSSWRLTNWIFQGTSKLTGGSVEGSNWGAHRPGTLPFAIQKAGCSSNGEFGLVESVQSI
jgi:hypothetical protein